jgi:ketosteroid isomerase-like protein
MSEENVELVRGILERWAVGNFVAGVADFDPHVVHVVGPSFPESGVFLGPERIRDYMHRFLAQWEHYTIEGKDVRAAGDTVLARVVQRGRGRSSGIDSEVESFMLFTFRGPRIVRMEMMLDQNEALEAVGLSESE